MEFYDEEERMAAARVANRAIVSTIVAVFGAVIGVPLVSLVLSPLIGFITVLIVIAVGASALATLRHPQAAVIGGTRVLGFVLGGVALFVGLLELAYVGIFVLDVFHHDQILRHANERVHF